MPRPCQGGGVAARCPHPPRRRVRLRAWAARWGRLRQSRVPGTLELIFIVRQCGSSDTIIAAQAKCLD